MREERSTEEKHQVSYHDVIGKAISVLTAPLLPYIVYAIATSLFISCMKGEGDLCRLLIAFKNISYNISFVHAGNHVCNNKS